MKLEHNPIFFNDVFAVHMERLYGYEPTESNVTKTDEWRLERGENGVYFTLEVPVAE